MDFKCDINSSCCNLTALFSIRLPIIIEILLVLSLDKQNFNIFLILYSSKYLRMLSFSLNKNSLVYNSLAFEINFSLFVIDDLFSSILPSMSEIIFSIY